MNNNISQSSETDSSLKSSGMNQISLDTLFSNLNKSLKNKFNSQTIPNPNVSINSTSNKKYIDFLKINQNYQSPSIKVLQHSPTAINYQKNTTLAQVDSKNEANIDFTASLCNTLDDSIWPKFSEIPISNERMKVSISQKNVFIIRTNL